MDRPLSVTGMCGLGDNIMQRPFVRAAAQNRIVYLSTPWPELYADLQNVRPCRSMTRLRTQAKHERATTVRWWMQPGGVRRRFSYGARALAEGRTIQQALEQALPLNGAPFVWDLPSVARPPSLDTGGRPLAFIRPVTERSEWHNAARSPDPDYVRLAAQRLMASHYVVAVADLAPGQEWLVGRPVPCHAAFLQGELSTMQVIELMRVADVAVGGVGWIVPAALAMGVRTFVYLGGNGGHNAPEVIVDPRADSSRLGFAMPRNYCRCADKHHDCDKSIDDPLEQFERWCSAQGVALCSPTLSARSPTAA